MPTYCVNIRGQENGDHEVHEVSACDRLPAPINRLDLGWHLDCRGAVALAKRRYPTANGCYWCCNPCHTS